MSAKVKQNYRNLRIALINKGTTIKRWATDQNYPVTTVYDAAKELRHGIKAMKIRRELEAYANE